MESRQQKIRWLAQKELERAEKEAADKEVKARENPFCGLTVHAAVEKRAYAEGFKAAMTTIFGAFDT